MGGRKLNLVAGLMAALLVAALLWLMLAPRDSGSGKGVISGPPKYQKGSNPNLDVRFRYDARYFKVGPFIDNAEFPFLLEGEGLIMQGKRIRGMAAWLPGEPISALYDWLGVMQMEGLEKYFDLSPAGEPIYEDWEVGGNLAVHQKLVYEIDRDKPRLPGYLSQQILTEPQKGDRAYIEGWVFFTDRDLFFFQAVSAQPLDEGQREACDDVLQSLQFNAMLGNETTAADDEAEPRDGELLDEPQESSGE